MLRQTLLLVVLVSPAAAQTLPDYSDNRSTAADVVASYYNAINRGEYLRAYSYFDYGTLGLYSPFAAGYADTAKVELRLGEVVSEGAAGTLHFAVPVALKATDRRGAVTVFTGCYLLKQAEPSIQGTPPFEPIQMVDGHLAKTSTPFASASGHCD